MLQIRSPDDSRLYSPQRDVAHCFPGVVALLVQRFQKRTWPELVDYLRAAGCDDDDAAAEAVRVFATAIHMSADVTYKHMNLEQVLTAAGWFNVAPALRVALTAHLGAALVGIFFQGARDASFGGGGPQVGLAEMLVTADESYRFMTRPRWRRWRCAQWLERKWRAVRGA